MTTKDYLVVFALGCADVLRSIAGDNFNQVDIAIQMLLSRKPKHGALFENGLRAVLLSPPNSRIKVIYEIDEENCVVYVVKIIGITH
jgi:hypothetical protein